MELKKLNPDVIAKIRSSCAINTVCQSVIELVLNSMDAKATSIAVRVNLVTLRIQVVDNGEGIPSENMKHIGIRYFTNKCNNLQDLETHIKYFGFRGEALANIAQLSKSVNITSRYKNTSSTYSKTIAENNSGSVAVYKERPSVGTTVTIEGFFQKYPVRRKRVVSELELDEIEKNIKGLVIMHPDVNFSIRDDINGVLILNARKSENVVASFKHLHPDITEDGTVIKITKGKITINALLFKKFSEMKKIQYIYANKRPIFSSKISKLVDKLFHTNKKQQKSQLKRINIHPVYVLNIKCPYADVDILLNPTKTTAQFKNWEAIERPIQKLINSFLGKNDSCQLNAIVKKPTDEKHKFNCGISQIQGAVRAFGYKRKSRNRDETSFNNNDENPPTKSILKNNQSNTVRSEGTCDIVESTPCLGDKKKRFKFEQPLPITIVPKKKRSMQPLCNREIPIRREIDCDKSISKFTNDENKGKDLIMDMFLKSTQVFKSEEDIKQFSQDSRETIYEEESNLVVENNFKSVLEGVSKTMSMSVNLKSTKKIRKLKKMNATKGVQTNFDGEMVSKCLQTTFKGPNAIFNETNDNNMVSDNYTLVFSKNVTQPRYKFVRKKPEPAKSFNFVFTQKQCVCNCHENPNKMFNFEENKSSERHTFDSKNVQSNYTCPIKIKNGHFDNANLILNSYWNINKKVKSNFKANIYGQSPYFKRRKFCQQTYQNITPPNVDKYLQPNYSHRQYAFQNNYRNIPYRPTELQNQVYTKDYYDDKVCDITLSFEKFKPFYRSTQQNVRHSDFQKPLSNNFNECFVDSFSRFQQKQHCARACENSPNFSNFPSAKQINRDNFVANVDDRKVKGMEEMNEDVSVLEVSLSEKEKLQLLEQELGAEKSILMKEFLEWNSQFTIDEKEMFTKDVAKESGYVAPTTTNNNKNWFLISERYDFLPKGMSPILKEVKQVDQSLSQNGKNVLLEYIMDTYKNELLYIKWQHYLKNVDSKIFFENMYKEKLKMFENGVPNAKTVNKKRENINGINLTRGLFKSLEVIGQLDRKFIVCKEIKENRLIIFDQHAVHERIRLEDLLKIYKSAKTACKEKMTFFMSRNELALLRRCESYLNYVGVSLEFFANGFYVTEVPLCLYVKFKGQDLDESLNKIIQVLINEVIELLKSTRGATLKTLPTLIHNVVSMEACRGAIKFGDSLSMKQCEELLQKLSVAELPFQCAHGRPTAIPLINLNINSAENLGTNPINFRSLHN